MGKPGWKERDGYDGSKDAGGEDMAGSPDDGEWWEGTTEATEGAGIGRRFK